jgi:ABC-type polysaccharide/polyol phosphate transport system ATPase subunit
MQPKIIFQNVSVRYRLPKERIRTFKEFAIQSLWHRIEYEEFWVFHDITFQIDKGAMIGIVGRNGTGKSTLLKLVAKVMKPIKGQVVVNGRVTPLLELGAGFDPELTAFENIYLFGSILGISHKKMREKVAKIIEFSELEEFIDSPLRTFSSGMTTRLGFAVATAVDPDILLLDEILAVGDAGFQKKSLDVIQYFRHSGVTILFVSHDLNQIRALCDQAIWLEGGEMRAWGEAGQVLQQYQTFLNGQR